MYQKLKEQITETTQYYLMRNVHPRAEQPFQVRDDDEMAQLVESIYMNGVLNPLIVTKRREAAMRSYRGIAAMPPVRNLAWRLFPLSSEILIPMKQRFV